MHMVWLYHYKLYILLEKIKAEITKLIKYCDSIIMNLPSTEHINGEMIFDKIFSTLNNPLTFASLYPFVHQSRNYKAKTTHIS